MILTVAGLSVVEIVSSLDNAIINADALATMGEAALRVLPDRESAPPALPEPEKVYPGKKMKRSP